MHHGKASFLLHLPPYHLVKRAKHRALLVRLPFSYSHYLLS